MTRTRALALALVGLLACMLAPGAANASDPREIYPQFPWPYLGSTGTSQVDYVTGMLETLAYIHANGGVPANVPKCLFEDVESQHNWLVLSAMANRLLWEADDRGEDASASWALLDTLAEECRSGRLLLRYPGVASEIFAPESSQD